MPDRSDAIQKLVVNEIEVQLFRRGFGTPVLFLHGIDGLDPTARFLHLLSERFDVIAPSHPGFDNSQLPEHCNRVDDIAFLYLDLIDQLGLRELIVIGASLGGWIAAEIASWCSHALSKLVLAGPIGIKSEDRVTPEIPDIFIRRPEATAELLYHDPARRALDSGPLSEEKLAVTGRNREMLARYVWEPYMHNPKLHHRLHRIRVPTLILRGASDGIISPAYIEAYSRMLPGSRIETIPAAGHEPQLEQPEEFVNRVVAFITT